MPDGDTIKLPSGTKVRYLGIDTPEVDHDNSRNSQPGADDAFRWNASLTRNKRIILAVPRSKAHDRYGRLFAYVYAPIKTKSGKGYVNITQQLLNEDMGDSKYGAADTKLPLAIGKKNIESLSSRITI